MRVYVCVFLASVFISSVSQIILKASADKHYDSIYKEYMNLKVIIAYALFILSSLITMMAYKKVPLSMGPILEASGYIFVTILGHFFLHEKVGTKKKLGLIIILVGIAIFNIGSYS